MPESAKRAANEETEESGYSFGCFRLDTRRGELLHNGEPVPLRPKTFDALRYLLENPNRVVSRDELFNALWPNQVVSDDSLTQCLSEIRKALQDEHRQLVRTVPRRGYLFEAEIRVDAGHRSQTDPPVQQEILSGRKELPSRWTLLSVFVLCCAVLALWWRLEFRSVNSNPADPGWTPLKASIAVLPFADASPTADQEHIADGIAEDILGALSRSPDLTVIARNSSFSFRQAELDVSAIARQLEVEYVLQGSVQRTGNRVRVNARLIRGRTGARVWDQDVEGRFGDEFAVQARIARGVADFLGVDLAGAQPLVQIGGRTDVDYRAREFFLRGKLFYARRLEGDVMRAQREFELAIDLDPGFADAWVALAATINLRRGSRRTVDEARLSGPVAVERMRDALEQALDLDPEHPEALWRIAALNWHQGNVEQAVGQLGEALQLGWNHAIVQAMIAGFAHNAGYTELAIPYSQRAITLDPVNESLLFNHALWLYTTGDLAAAEHAFRRLYELAPGRRGEFNARLTWIRLRQGDLDSAADLTERLPSGLTERLPSGPDLDQAEAILAHLRGDQFASDQALERLLGRPALEVADRLAFVYAIRGQPDEAFEWLTVATEALINSEFGWRSERGRFVTLQRSPLLRSLHGDPRWSEWVSETEHLLRSEDDRRVVAMIREYRSRHPELYPPPGR